MLQIKRKDYNLDRDLLMQKLEKKGIQTRPVWKLNHEQKPYKKYQSYRIKNAENLVENSLCLPSSSNLTNDNLNKIIHHLDG